MPDRNTMDVFHLTGDPEAAIGVQGILLKEGVAEVEIYYLGERIGLTELGMVRMIDESIGKMWDLSISCGCSVPLDVKENT